MAETAEVLYAHTTAEVVGAYIHSVFDPVSAYMILNTRRLFGTGLSREARSAGTPEERTMRTLNLWSENPSNNLPIILRENVSQLTSVSENDRRRLLLVHASNLYGYLASNYSDDVIPENEGTIPPLGATSKYRNDIRSTMDNVHRVVQMLTEEVSPSDPTTRR